ncbi:hypothetical protein C8F01DRAFT_1252544 [Mycena amicta]|nr:hypothetical protein C8F01DRAFT_1252544 [Mycena amicta]
MRMVGGGAKSELDAPFSNELRDNLGVKMGPSTPVRPITRSKTSPAVLSGFNPAAAPPKKTRRDNVKFHRFPPLFTGAKDSVAGLSSRLDNVTTASADLVDACLSRIAELEKKVAELTVSANIRANTSQEDTPPDDVNDDILAVLESEVADVSRRLGGHWNAICETIDSVKGHAHRISDLEHAAPAVPQPAAPAAKFTAGDVARAARKRHGAVEDRLKALEERVTDPRHRGGQWGPRVGTDPSSGGRRGPRVGRDPRNDGAQPRVWRTRRAAARQACSLLRVAHRTINVRLAAVAMVIAVTVRAVMAAMAVAMAETLAMAEPVAITPSVLS